MSENGQPPDPIGDALVALERARRRMVIVTLVLAALGILNLATFVIRVWLW